MSDLPTQYLATSHVTFHISNFTFLSWCEVCSASTGDTKYDTFSHYRHYTHQYMGGAGGHEEQDTKWTLLIPRAEQLFDNQKLWVSAPWVQFSVLPGDYVSLLQMWTDDGLSWKVVIDNNCPANYPHCPANYPHSPPQSPLNILEHSRTFHWLHRTFTEI
jgi:hypothetical protein